MATATQQQKAPTPPKTSATLPASESIALGHPEIPADAAEPFHTGDHFALWIWVVCFSLMWVMQLFQFFAIPWWRPLEIFR